MFDTEAAIAFHAGERVADDGHTCQFLPEGGVAHCARCNQDWEDGGEYACECGCND